MAMLHWRYMAYGTMWFNSRIAAFHLMKRGMPDGNPCLGNRASCMHGGPVFIIAILQMFVMVLMPRFLCGFIMAVQWTFHLLLCL